MFKTKKLLYIFKFENNNQYTTSSIIKPKLWKLFNWLIFCAFSISFKLLSKCANIFISFYFVILVALAIKLYLMNKLSPLNFTTYIVVFLLIFILCEYNLLEIVLFKIILNKQYKLSAFTYNTSDFYWCIYAILSLLQKSKLLHNCSLVKILFNRLLTTLTKHHKKLLLLSWWLIFCNIWLCVSVPVIINFIYAMANRCNSCKNHSL